tara:strand:- start:87 stop:1076 length:990 start_codon:yes stop_codon:yes gene_type:complete
MNIEVYEELKQQIPNFDNLYCENVNVEDIEFDPYNTQIRQKGHVIERVPSMAESLDTHGQDTPCSGRKKANGKVELKEGATRVLGARHAKIKQIKMSFYHDSLNYTPAQWYDFQSLCNDHKPQTSNTDNDIKHQIQTRVDKGYLEQTLGYKYHSDPEKWISDSADHLIGVYKHSSWNRQKIKNHLENCLTATVSTMYQNYTKDLAMEHVEAFNNSKWSTDKENKSKAVGDICNNVCFYTAAYPRELSKDVLAYAAYKAIDNPNVDIKVVVWDSKLAGKTDKKIKETRKKFEKEYDKINNHYGIFSGLYLLPQFKTGINKENLKSLIKIR